MATVRKNDHFILSEIETADGRSGSLDLVSSELGSSVLLAASDGNNASNIWLDPDQIRQVRDWLDARCSHTTPHHKEEA